MSKHRHLPLIFGFLMMAASAAAGQIKAPADEVNTAASPFNTATSPFNAGQVNTHTGPFSSPFNTAASPFNTATRPFNAGQVNTHTGPFNSPFNTTASPFNTATSPFNAGQVNTHTGPFKTARPGEPVERHLSDDQKFREWSLQSDATDVTKRIKVCRVETVCKMRFKEGPRRGRASGTSSCHCGTTTRPFLFPKPSPDRSGRRWTTCGTSRA